MKNIVSNSIFFIFISFILLFLIIYFNTVSSSNILEVINYILYENKGLFVFFSQFIFVVLNKKLTNREIIFNTILCWFTYLFLNYFFTDTSLFTINESVSSDLYINREEINSRFSLLNFDFIQQILNDIELWDLREKIPSSTFVLLLLNGSIIAYINEITKNNILVLVVTFITLVLLILYFWTTSINIFIFIISIMLLKIRKFNA